MTLALPSRPLPDPGFHATNARMLLPIALVVTIAGVAPADANKDKKEKETMLEVPAQTVSTAACKDAPKGMACVVGGPATVGSDDGAANEKPKRQVQISTFYVDKAEATVGD